MVEVSRMPSVVCHLVVNARIIFIGWRQLNVLWCVV